MGFDVIWMILISILTVCVSEIWKYVLLVLIVIHSHDIMHIYSVNHSLCVLEAMQKIASLEAELSKLRTQIANYALNHVDLSDEQQQQGEFT